MAMRSPDPSQADRAHIQACWARLLLASLADAGVRHVVISPGSRSTPFVLAAAGEPRLRLHDVVDERSAAFLALGIGRATGRPALLLCTSGTAGAHYLPAVIEAGMARVPLLALTADRPVELVDCGANQTIDQLKLFGDHARAFVDLGMADEHPDALRGLRRMAAGAVFRSTWPEAGAVHLNARARKPLEPPAEAGDEGRMLQQRVAGLLGRPIVRPSLPRLEAKSGDVDALAALCRRIERGLIVAGAAAPAQGSLAELAAELSERTGYPLLADATSQLRSISSRGLRIDGFDPLLAALETGVAGAVSDPELVIQIGRPPTSGAWSRRLVALGRAGGAPLGDFPEGGGVLHHFTLTTDGFPDAESTATRLLVAEPRSVLEGLLERLAPEPRQSAWRRRWKRWAAVTADSIERSLEEGRALQEGHVARAAWRGLPANGQLMVGNSLAVRLLDTYGSSEAGSGNTRKDSGPRSVLSQRGASGIDGLISGAVGAAIATARPTLVYLGDLSLLHDLGGLAHLPSEPFVILTTANGGGRIFEQLPLASHPASEGRFTHWTTPRPNGFEALASHFGLGYRKVSAEADLESALALAFEAGGAWLVEAEVPAHGAAEERRKLVAELRSRLAERAAEGRER